MQTNFISLKYSKETRNVYTTGCNVEFMMGNETNDVTEELRKSLLQNYKKDLKKQ